MKVAVFSTKPYDRKFLEQANESLEPKSRHSLTFLECQLDGKTIALAHDHDAVCAFVNDQLDGEMITRFSKLGGRAIAMRCAGYNNVDLAAAAENNISVVRVPAYSPYAVAEHTLGMILALNRKIHRAYNRVREGNFALDGLLGFDLHGKTVAVIGTGKIGVLVAERLLAFGCHVVAYDPFPNDHVRELGIEYKPLDQAIAEADIVTLHCPLTADNFHLIDAEHIARMKWGVMIINTSRGGLIDTQAAIQALKIHHIGSLALDVYEQESALFFENMSEEGIEDDIFARLLTFPNVLITGHQAFFTQEALTNIAETTIANLTELERNGTCNNEILPLSL
ncbi:MAG: 2-hydroxyacid dehydrogenase [Cyanobacteria bacterium P01_C01_bin.89]